MEATNVTPHTRRMIGTFVTIKNGTMVLTTHKGITIGTYRLTRIQEEKLLNLRLSMRSICIIKSNKQYAFANVEHSLNLNNAFGKHLCAHCVRCLASSKQGGCQKVSDLSANEYVNLSKRQAIQLSKRMEKYDFIKKGIETVGCYPYNAFIVLQCDNFKPENNNTNDSDI